LLHDAQRSLDAGGEPVVCHEPDTPVVEVARSAETMHVGS
jgi:hypothetical protein